MSKWTEHRTIKDVSIEVEGQEDLVNLHIEVEVTIARDNNYGADADGRRGVVQDFVDDWKIESIFDVETGDDVTEKFKKDPQVIRAVEEEL